MPVVFRDGGLRYYFFSNEGSPPESPHIHIKGGGCDAKIWIEPEVTIADSYGFNSGELSYNSADRRGQSRPYPESVA